MADQHSERFVSNKTSLVPFDPPSLTEIESTPNPSHSETGKHPRRKDQRKGRKPTKVENHKTAVGEEHSHVSQSLCTSNDITKNGGPIDGSACRSTRSVDVGDLNHSQALRFARNITPSTQPSMNPVRLFVASLGNPPPYASTRHSAGHIILKSLQSSLSFPTFQRSKPYANGLTSTGADVGRPEWTLWQSPSLMNVSGTGLLKAYKTFVSAAQETIHDKLPTLVVLYDEMETSPGQLRLRRGATSAKGHNGLKSVQQSLQSAGLMEKLGDRFVKIGVGIGRPAGGSRTSEDVSRYVLGQVTNAERQAIDAKVPELMRLLEAEAMREVK